MNKIKPFEKIAEQFQISHESAKYFLNHVQKSFRTEKPSHTLILQFIELQKLDFLLTPFEVAALMNESGAWKFALVSAPPVIENDEDNLSDWDD
jgi:hypothetical protein